MSQTTCLHSLIHEVDASTAAAEPGQKRVMFHIGQKRIVTSEWFRPVGTVKYFLVSTSAVANCVVSVIHVVDNGHQGKAIGLKIELTVRCLEGNEDRVVEALGADTNPGTALFARIKEWSREYLNRQPAFFDSFATAKFELATHLTSRARNEVGLDLLVEVSLYGDPGAVGPTSLGPLELQVETQDSRELFHVRLMAELAPDNFVDAVAYRGEHESLPDLVRQSAQAYFSESVSAAQLFHELDQVGAGLKLYLNERMKTVGWRVHTLRLETDETVEEPDSEVRQRVEYKGLGQSEPLFVTDIARFSVHDYGTYVRSNISDLSQWLAQTLSQVTEKTLGEKTYPNILLDLRSISRDIANKISFKAATIGCAIQQQVVITNPTLEEWSKEFEVSTEETFPTLFEKFQIRLSIVVVTALRQPEQAINYLARGIDLTDLFKRKINDEVRRVLEGVHPMRLCEQFISNQASGEEPVRVILDRSIRERLAGDFNAELISLSIESAESSFTKSLNSFWNESIVFESEFSENARHGALAVYSIDCQTEEITADGWVKAAAAGFDFARFKTQLVSALKGELENYDPLDAGGAPSDSVVKVKAEISAIVTTYARREFGLVLRVRSIRRKVTDAEKKLRDAAAANELERIELIRKLEQHVLQLIANGSKAEEIARSRASIAELKAYSTFVVPGSRERTPLAATFPNGTNAAIELREDCEVAK